MWFGTSYTLLMGVTSLWKIIWHYLKGDFHIAIIQQLAPGCMSWNTWMCAPKTAALFEQAKYETIQMSIGQRMVRVILSNGSLH